MCSRSGHSVRIFFFSFFSAFFFFIVRMDGLRFRDTRMLLYSMLGIWIPRCFNAFNNTRTFLHGVDSRSHGRLHRESELQRLHGRPVEYCGYLRVLPFSLPVSKRGGSGFGRWLLLLVVWRTTIAMGTLLLLAQFRWGGYRNYIFSDSVCYDKKVLNLPWYSLPTPPFPKKSKNEDHRLSELVHLTSSPTYWNVVLASRLNLGLRVQVDRYLELEHI